MNKQASVIKWLSRRNHRCDADKEDKQIASTDGHGASERARKRPVATSGKLGHEMYRRELMYGRKEIVGCISDATKAVHLHGAIEQLPWPAK